MSAVQVGGNCYADQPAAAAAACAAHMPTTSVQGDSLVGLSCAGVSVEGALVMRTASTPVGSASAPVFTDHELMQDYAPCTQADVVGGSLLIVAALIAAWAPAYGLWKVTQWLGWGRGEAT